MKYSPKIALLAPPVTAFPLTCRADMGSVAGAVVIAFWVALAIWSGLALCVFLLLRRRTALTRIAATALFLISPVLVGATILFKEVLFDEQTVQVNESTQGPLKVASATFPAGSLARYEQTGSVFDQHVLAGRHTRCALLEIHSPSAVLLGDLRITGLKFDGGSTHIYVDLAGDQIIDGWSCAAGPFGPELSLTPGGTKLRSCWLSAPREWHGRLVPVGVNVTRAGDTDDWYWIPPD